MTADKLIDRVKVKDNLRIVGNGYSPKNVFRSRGRDTAYKANVLMYMNESGLQDPDDSSRYLSIMLANNPYFDVSISTHFNSHYAEEADIVIPRFDPPVSLNFLGSLEKYNDGSRFFINPPKTQSYFGNKSYLEDLVKEVPGLFPKTLVESDPVSLAYFMFELSHEGNEYVVSKPLVGSGGDGILKHNLREYDKDGLLRLAFELTNNGCDKIILQDYIRNVKMYGDKRVHVVDGEAIGSLLRIPAEGEFRCNLKKGGSNVVSEISPEDRDIVEMVRPILKRHNVYWAGLDIVGPYLGEINAVSPGIVIESDLANGIAYRPGSVGAKMVDKIENSIRYKALTNA